MCPVCMLRQALGGEDESGEPAPVSHRFEHYELVTGKDGKPVELGRGAMGVTFKASDTVLGNDVALKVIDARIAAHPEARERFLREACAAARLRHPNVASVFYYGVRKTDGQCFYAMELVEGETLEARLRRAGPLPPALALEVIAQEARALVAAEAHGLVHRDLKPANLMIVGGAEIMVKVIDFGLAKAVSTAVNEADLTHGGFVGTPAFASPEQFTSASLDVRSDLYSLGIALWDMLTGQTPFRGSPTEVMDQHQRAALPLEQVKGVPQPMVILLEVLLKKDPKCRFQSPAELINALPKVADAVKERRSITQQSLREFGDEGRGAPGKATRVLARLQAVVTNRRVTLVLWPALALLVAGGLILMVNAFSGSGHRVPNAPIASSGAINAPEKSIAVLPFENISSNKDDAYFADGVQDEILNNLAKIAQLKVISRTSVMQYRSDNKRDLRQIATALGVTNVLEGAVRRDGNHVRVSTELVDARNDNTIWADSYDRDLTNIFSTQSEIAQTVASRLSAQLSPEERKDIEEKPTNNLEAYDLYLQAKQLLGPNSDVVLRSSEKATFSKAISLLEEATQKDRNFALAYCMIANAHDYLYYDRVDPTPERRALGDAAINEALRLRPGLAEVHLAAAFHLFSCYRDFERARVQIAIAAQVLPNNSDLLQITALIDRVQGRWDKAVAGLARAATLDPRNADLLTTLADTYRCLRRYRDYERISERLVELEPDQPLLTLYKAESAFAEKADLKGIRAAYEALPTSMKDDAKITLERVYYAVCARDFATAGEILSKSPNEEVGFFGPLVPRRIVAL